METSTTKKPRPPRGSAIEILVWRLTERTSTGMRRTCVYNAVVGSDLFAILFAQGPGRFRVEWRDRQRQIIRVAAFEVTRTGVVGRVPPLRRTKARKIPPPRWVPKGTDPSLVANAPYFGPLPPERAPARTAASPTGSQAPARPPLSPGGRQIR